MLVIAIQQSRLSNLHRLPICITLDWLRVLNPENWLLTRRNQFLVKLQLFLIARFAYTLLQFSLLRTRVINFSAILGHLLLLIVYDRNLERNNMALFLIFYRFILIRVFNFVEVSLRFLINFFWRVLRGLSTWKFWLVL